jgi:predicted Kef-type K+ transport protein
LGSALHFSIRDLLTVYPIASPGALAQNVTSWRYAPPCGSLGLDLDRIAMRWLMLPGLRGRIAELASETGSCLEQVIA